jgi:hypothetical protein
VVIFKQTFINLTFSVIILMSLHDKLENSDASVINMEVRQLSYKVVKYSMYSGASVYELNPFLEAVRKPKCS